MVAIDTSSASRGATLARISLTVLLMLPIGFVGFSYAASGPLGIPLAIPPLYMLWVFGVDVSALMRGDAYRARPAYKWFVVAGVLVVAMWIGVLLAHGGTFFGIRATT
jgi:hypothetical protein